MLKLHGPVCNTNSVANGGRRKTLVCPFPAGHGRRLGRRFSRRNTTVAARGPRAIEMHAEFFPAILPRAGTIHANQSVSVVAARARERAAQLAAAAGRARTVAAADGHHHAVHCRVSRPVVLAVLFRAAVHREISRPRRGVDRTADVCAVRVSVRAAALEQPGHQPHQPVSQPGDDFPAVAAGAGADHFPLEIHRVHRAGVVGVSVSDRAAAGGVRPGARRAVAFLCGDAVVDCNVHRAAGRAGRGPGDCHRTIFGPARFSNRAGGGRAGAAGAGGVWWQAQPVDDELVEKRTLQALDQLLAKTRFTLFPFLPGYWLSAAVLQWAEGILRGAVFLRWCC